MKLLKEVKSILDKEKYYSNEGYLLKGKIIEETLNLDIDLIKTLKENKKTKEHFFIKLEDETMIFDKDKFINFIKNKEFLSNSYTAYSNKIGLTDLKGGFLNNKNDVVLSWPYKDCYLEGGQTKRDQEKNEVFYNKTLAPDEIDRLLAPKVLTNFKRININGKKELTDITMDDNLIIKGNNLLALHSLKEKYKGEIELIYIDIPFNTKNDSFNYNDNFNYSTWLTFIKNRVEIAKTLLSDTGFIFVHTSYHMYPYLKILLDEVFNDNHICTFNVKVRHSDRILKGDKDFHDVVEYLPVYTKDKTKNKISKRKFNNDIDD